ncbi:bacteriohemerythrin [Rhizomicrobium electricum]|uniref:Hemerythrin-like domain-containing protein n=1 Tax=Rhizomicrobium electricum TaxID=480070 RepID=A0ABN1EVN5_9PROT|nr:hemerythrin domain-containing protein [Rhizomicrobium electricum]NIJ49491.1 hemerythrin-like metal-binding protein [Rhizomicrobium electricum]
MDQASDTLALGVNAIDREHHALMSLIAKFIAYLKAEADAEVALAALREAIMAGNAHMEHEEELMAQSDYPGAEEHKLHHRTARLNYTTLMSDVFAFQAHDPALLEQSARIEAMLQHHISGPDRQFAEYLKARGVN